MARLAPGSAAVSGRPPRRAPGSRPASRRAPCPTRTRRPRGHVGPATTDENRRPQHPARRPRAGRSAAPPAQRAPHRPLLPRCWELRDNLTIYDAAYMELAEAMDATLLTGDRRLARAPGPSAHRDPPAAHASAQYRLLSAHRSATAPPGRRADLADLRRPSTLGHADERIVNGCRYRGLCVPQHRDSEWMPGGHVLCDRGSCRGLLPGMDGG